MRKPILEDVTIEITNRCQLRCRACGIWREKGRHEMSVVRFARMMTGFFQKNRVEFVSLTGGEPFLHPRIVEMLQFLATMRACGHIKGIGVYTNGIACDVIERVFRMKMPALGKVAMGVSVDGCESTHDLLRGSGAYRKTMRSVAFLAEECQDKVDLELKFTINSMNYTEIDEVYALARRWGAKFSPKIMEHDVAHYYHRQNTPKAVALARLTEPMRVVAGVQLSRILHRMEGGVNVPMVKAVCCFLENGPGAIASCDTPQRSLFITSRGELYPCLYMGAAGRLDVNGNIPSGYDAAKAKRSVLARHGQCPRCMAYHGFLKSYNLRYLIS